ncbi:MAG: hypothetical protein ACI4TZ_00400 [Christensenellales bacterium]
MENSNDLQTALNHFNLFYKNINNLIKQNKKANKKLFGHSIFKKSDNVVFNVLESLFLIAVSTFSCAVLKYKNLLPYDFFLSAGATCIATSTIAMIFNNVVYHINNHTTGIIGRTYAQMQCDDYFDVLIYYIKKDCKALLSSPASNEQKKESLIKFSETLDNISTNLQSEYEKFCNKVDRFSPRKQKKWQPILEHMKEYSLYLSNNAEKFNTFAERLQNADNPLLIKTDESLDKLEVSCDKQHSSEYIEFKKYLEYKKYLENKEHFFDKFNNCDNTNTREKDNVSTL